MKLAHPNTALFVREPEGGTPKGRRACYFTFVFNAVVAKKRMGMPVIGYVLVTN